MDRLYELQITDYKYSESENSDSTKPETLIKLPKRWMTFKTSYKSQFTNEKECDGTVLGIPSYGILIVTSDNNNSKA